MSTWVIISWVSVAILTGVNIFVFLKMKNASEQMLKMAFPGAKDMTEAVSQMQKMMGSMGAGGKGGFNPAALAGMMGGGPGASKGGVSEAQLKAATDMLKKMQQGGPKR